MNNCTSGCKTQDHNSYAECLQSKTIQAIGVFGSKNITLDRNLAEEGSGRVAVLL
jgi:hypothetical protein